MHKTAVESALAGFASGLTAGADAFDVSKDHEVQTDKDQVKLVPCRECQRPLVVTTFFAPAKALCASCRGETASERAVATIGQPIPGQTDPAKAVNLADCLVNPHFATALCPVHPDDQDHVMELKSVSHSEHYGPGHYEVSKGTMIWKQDAPGEVATHQCVKCNAVVVYQTTIRTQYQRQNAIKPKPDLGPPERNYMHGLESPKPASEKAA